MATGYRSFSMIDAGKTDPFHLTREQIVSWLRHKKLNADLLIDDGTSQLADDTVAWVGSWTTRDSRQTERFRLREQKSTGTWTTTVTVSSRDEKTWLLVDVSHEPKLGADGEPAGKTIQPRVPGLIKRLAGAVDLSDGRAVLRHEPEMLSEDRIGELIDVLCSPDRRGPVFVAGSDETLPLEVWRAHVAGLVEETVGLAAAYVLTPGATRKLSKKVGERFGVSPGAIRTYLAEVDPAVDEDSRRHRVLSTQSVATRSERSIKRMFADVAFNQTLDLPLPKDVQRQLGVVDRGETILLIQQAPERPLDLQEQPPKPTAATPHQDEPNAAVHVDAREDATATDESKIGRSTRGTIRRLLGVKSPKEIPDKLEEQLATAQAQSATIREFVARDEAAAATVNSQRQTIESLREDLQDVQLDGGVEAEENTRLRDLLARTQRSLNEATAQLARDTSFDRWDEISQPDAPSAAPIDLNEVLERFNEMEYLEFTGDADDLYDLRDRDNVGTFAFKTWSALQALNDYVRAKRDGAVNGDIRQYVEHTPAGYVGIAKNQLALAESQTVRNNPKFYSERMLPVPNSVSPNGRIYMKAHIKIAKQKSISPRLYFYDDIAGTGKIYVGYIGRHMSNTLTN